MPVIQLVSPPFRERLVQQAKLLLFAAGLFLPMLMFGRNGTRELRSVVAARSGTVSAMPHVATLHTNNSTQRLITEKN